jgi:hypothetical protein
VATSNDQRARINRAFVFAWLGFVLERRNDIAGAREAGDLVQRELVGVGNAEGLETKWQERLNLTLGNLTTVEWATELKQHRLDDAQATAKAGIALAEQAPAAPAEHERFWTTDLEFVLADVAAARGDRTMAERLYRQVLDNYTHMAEASPNDDDPTRSFSEAAVSFATLLLAKRGGRNEARELLERAVDFLGPRHESHQLIAEHEELLSRARQLLAQSR